MRITFPGWYAKTPEQLDALWATAIIVPDTNIILHLLRHSAKVRNQLMDLFDRKKEALWIPYQVGSEFQRRRMDVQQQAADAYGRLLEDVTSFVNQAKNRLNQHRAHPVIEIERELSALDVYLSDFRKRMSEAEAEHPTEELGATFDKVTALFSGRVGSKPLPDRIAAIRKEGEDRYAKKIPPGFEDAKKGAGTHTGEKFGDLFIWKEMIDKAKADQRPMIFVTDDGKADWWYIHRGRKIGSHPELVEEFLAATGQQFHIYELLQFLKYVGEADSGIHSEAMQHIAEAVLADSEAASTLYLPERSRVLNVLRAELRDKEADLDQMIRSLIDLPPKTDDTEALPRDDTKRSLREKIAEVTERINALRAEVITLESEADGTTTRT